MNPVISTVQAWGPLVGVIAIMVGLVSVWIRGIPARLLAKNAGDATLRGEERGLREYLNAELAKCKAESDALGEKVKAQDRRHKQDMEDRDEQHARDLKIRDDKIFQLGVVAAMFLRKELIDDPDSDLVKRAKAVLELTIGFVVHPAAIDLAVERLMGVAAGTEKSSKLVAAESAVVAAEQTVIRAEKTVIEVKVDERPAAEKD